MKVERLDDTQSIFFNRQLEFLKKRAYDNKYPNLRARDLFPVSFDAGEGAETITFDSYDAVGSAKLINSYSDDLPRADVVGMQNRTPVKSIGASFGYAFQEIRAASMAGKDLQQRRANAARRAMMQKENDIAFFGDAATGLLGILSNPNIPRTVAAAAWSTSTTATAFLDDLSAMANNMVMLTKGAEIPDTLLLPISQYHLIGNKRIDNTTGDKSVLKYFLENNAYIKNVAWVNELTGAGYGGTNVAIAYRRDPDVLTMEVPMDFRTYPPQADNLAFKVPCEQRTGGVIVYLPMAVSILEGI